MELEAKLKRMTKRRKTGTDNVIPLVFSYESNRDRKDKIDNISFKKRNKTMNEACKNGDIDTVKRLLKDPTVDPAKWDNMPFLIACYYCCLKYHGQSTIGPGLKLIEILMTDPRINPAACNNNAIINASYYGYYNLTKLLLSDPRVVKEGLDHAILQSKDSTIKELLQHAQYDIGGEKYMIAKSLFNNLDNI